MNSQGLQIGMSSLMQYFFVSSLFMFSNYHDYFDLINDFKTEKEIIGLKQNSVFARKLPILQSSQGSSLKLKKMGSLLNQILIPNGKYVTFNGPFSK